MSLRGRRHGGGRKNELVFLTTCGPATTFDPKITGPNGTWFFDDGTTLDATSGVEISKTFAAEGLHRAVFRPASGGLAAITAIDAQDDCITLVDVSRLPNLTTLTFRDNPNCALLVMPAKLQTVDFVRNTVIATSLTFASFPRSILSINIGVCPTFSDVLSNVPPGVTTLNVSGANESGGSLSDMPCMGLQTGSFNNNNKIEAGSISAFVALRTLIIHSMSWLTADVDAVIDSMWSARANYTYATPALQIGGTNQAMTGNVTAPVEGADWHQDGATWIPLTTGAKAYDLAKDVNSEGFNKWTITYTGGSIAP